MWPAVVAGGVAFVLYAVAASPWGANGDVAEFQTLAATGGIAHAGYPLFVMLLHAAAALPVGTIALRAALLSSAAGAVAVALLAGHGSRLSGRAWIGLAAGIALALSPALWREASRAEVYAFTLAISAALYLAARAYFADPSPRRAALAALFAGWGLVSHLGILGLLTPLALLFAARLVRGRIPAAHVAAAALGLLAGLVPPLLYMLAHDRGSAPMNYLGDTFGALAPGAGLATRAQRLASLLSARQFLEASGVAFRPFAHLAARLRMLAVDLVVNDTPLPGLVLALAGVVALVRRRSNDAFVLVGWIVAQVFWLALAAYDDVVVSFFLSPLWALAALQAHGLAGLHRLNRTAAIAAAILLVAWPAGRALLAEPPGAIAAHAAGRSAWDDGPRSLFAARNDSTWEHGSGELLRSLAPRALVLACWDEGTSLRYVHLARAVRPDVEIRWRCRDAAALRADVAEADAQGRPAYATYDPAGQLPPERTASRVGRWAVVSLWRIEGR